jgi:D-glucosaminate-6-phosphate ammonia-lyase
MHRPARAAILMLLSAVLVSAAPANIAGQWQFTVELAVGTGRPLVTFKQDGEKITGTYEGRYGKSNLEGTVKENHVEFIVTVVAEGETASGRFSGTVENDKMSGDVDYDGAGEGTWAAVRVPAKK